MNLLDFVSPFTFINHSIANLTVKNNILNLKKEESKSSLDLDYKVFYSGAEEEIHFGIVELVLKTSINQPAKKSFKCGLTLQGAFSAGKKAMDVEKFDEMLRYNGTSALYSIARSIIIDISSKSMIDGQIRLPLINVVEFCKAKENAEKHGDE